jgi:hypothetical protein
VFRPVQIYIGDFHLYKGINSYAFSIVWAVVLEVFIHQNEFVFRPLHCSFISGIYTYISPREIKRPINVPRTFFIWRLTIIYGCIYSFMVLLLFLSIISASLSERVRLNNTNLLCICLTIECLSCRYTLVPASVYLGFCASIIWVGQVH